MSNVRFLYNFAFDAAAITASSEVSGLPAANVAQEFVARKWRAAGDSAEWVKFDLGAAKKITMAAIFGHNLTSGAVITIEANDTDSWETPAYSAAITWHELALVKFLDQTYRWWRITFADAANPDGYVEIGRICAGEYYEPGVNVVETVQKNLIDPSRAEESDGGQTYVIEKPKYRVYAVKFSDIARPQQDELEAMFRTVGITRNLVFALDPDGYPQADTIYCKIKGGLSRALGALEYGDVPLTLEEKV